jgi:hypothetical protein
MAADGQIHLQPLLQGTQLQLFQASYLFPGEGGVGQVLERCASDQRESVAKVVARSFQIVFGARPSGGREQNLEPVLVELPDLHAQPVSGWLRDEPRPICIVGEDAT